MSLQTFITESNKIENESNVKGELQLYQWFLGNTLSEENTKTFHMKLATLRKQLKMKHRGHYRKIPVYIGRKKLLPEKVKGDMEDFWELIYEEALYPHTAHCIFESIHPFVDLNGRVGRAIWLHMMDGNAPLGFLHTWYYQSLT